MFQHVGASFVRIEATCINVKNGSQIQTWPQFLTNDQNKDDAGA